MKLLGVVGLAFLMLCVEGVLVRLLGLSFVRIDVTVVLLVYLGLRAPTVPGAFAAFAIGYLLDVLSGFPTGLYPFLGVATFLLVRMLSSLVDARSPIPFAVVCALASLGHGSLSTLFTFLTQSTGGTVTPLAGLPLQAALTVLTAFIAWPLLRFMALGVERPVPGALR